MEHFGDRLNRVGKLGKVKLGDINSFVERKQTWDPRRSKGRTKKVGRVI